MSFLLYRIIEDYRLFYFRKVSLLFPNIKFYYLPGKYYPHENENAVLQQYCFSVDHVSLDTLSLFVLI